MEKVFFCYDKKDEIYLRLLNKEYQKTIYNDKTNDRIKSINLNDEDAIQNIRDEVLQDTIVTIILVGKSILSNEEISKIAKASMITGEYSDSSGIIVVFLPEMKDLEDRNNYLPEVVLNNIKNIKQFEWDDIDWVKFSYAIKKLKQERFSIKYKI